MRLSPTNVFYAAGLWLMACFCAHGQGLAGSQNASSAPLSFRVPGFVLTVVSDAPYSGRTQVTRKAPDGNQLGSPITRETVWRDSKGRVRTEPNRQTPPALIYIDDPVAGFSYVLNPVDHIAHRAAAPRVELYTGSDANAGLLQSNPSCNPPVVDRLGNKEMAGIKATGLRSTTICPPDTYQGNDRQLTITDETWKSADYNLTLVRKRTDPTSGEVTTSIEDFKAAEPDPSLFRIPQEYRVVDETAPFTIAVPQDPGRGGAGSPPGLVSVRVQGPGFGGTFSLNGSLLVVKEAPYSGREVITQDQTLPDGTQLHQASGQNPDGTKMWRDSAGKVRTEHTGRGGSWTLVEIADPAGYGYLLDPWNRIAHRYLLREIETNDRAVRGRYDLPVNDGAFPSTSTNPRGLTTVAEKIGTQTMSGVSVTGYRATTTGAGPAQNRTSEVWEYAPYGLALLAKQTQAVPNGVVRTQTTAIEDFSPKEPDPALFRIPEGYRIVEETGVIAIQIPEAAK